MKITAVLLVLASSAIATPVEAVQDIAANKQALAEKIAQSLDAAFCLPGCWPAPPMPNTCPLVSCRSPLT
jgi:hypothetical protein